MMGQSVGNKCLMGDSQGCGNMPRVINGSV